MNYTVCYNCYLSYCREKLSKFDVPKPFAIHDCEPLFGNPPSMEERLVPYRKMFYDQWKNGWCYCRVFLEKNRHSPEYQASIPARRINPEECLYILEQIVESQ